MNQHLSDPNFVWTSFSKKNKKIKNKNKKQKKGKKKEGKKEQ